MNKTYVCRKLFLYRFLTKKGFEPFKVDIDKYDCKKNIWLYTDSNELRDCVEEYYSLYEQTQKNIDYST